MKDEEDLNDIICNKLHKLYLPHVTLIMSQKFVMKLVSYPAFILNEIMMQERRKVPTPFDAKPQQIL